MKNILNRLSKVHFRNQNLVNLIQEKKADSLSHERLRLLFKELKSREAQKYLLLLSQLKAGRTLQAPSDQMPKNISLKHLNLIRRACRLECLILSSSVDHNLDSAVLNRSLINLISINRSLVHVDTLVEGLAHTNCRGLILECLNRNFESLKKVNNFSVLLLELLTLQKEVHDRALEVEHGFGVASVKGLFDNPTEFKKLINAEEGLNLSNALVKKWFSEINLETYKGINWTLINEMIINSQEPLGSRNYKYIDSLEQNMQYLLANSKDLSGVNSTEIVATILHKMIMPALMVASRKMTSLNDRLLLFKVKYDFHKYRDQYGMYPDKPEELVPYFLNSLPPDPYDGRQLKYSQSLQKLWFTGPDLKDDGGVGERSLNPKYDYEGDLFINL